MVAVRVRRSMRPTWPVTKPPRGALSMSPSLAWRTCSASPTPARRALRRPADHERGEQGGVDLVAHGVGQREVQHVALEREVEGVAADVAGGLQPARERELPGLARVRARQQAVLDLGGQRQGHRALAPLEEVGEPAVGDDHVRQGVGRERDLGQHLLVRRLGEQKLEDADGLPAVGHRREHARPVRAGFEHERLGGERTPGSAVHQRHPLGGLVTLRARGCAAAGVAEPDERVAAEVRDEERHLPGVQLARKALAEDIGSGERRSVLNRREQLHKVEPHRGGVLHQREPPSAAGKVIRTSVPRAPFSLIASRCDSKPMIDSPRPSPGLSGRGSKPRPSSRTATTSSPSR